MRGEDLEAGNNLQTLSQRTSYITDWVSSAKFKPNRYQEPLLKEEHEKYLPLIVRRQPHIQKKTSDKYDLRNYKKKLQEIQK